MISGQWRDSASGLWSVTSKSGVSGKEDWKGRRMEERKIGRRENGKTREAVVSDL